MEKHKCKLCFRNFSNGRALGGHMRSHMMNLPIPPKQNESPPPPPPMVQLSFEAESASFPSSSSSEDNKGLCYGLRENPKRSFRLADPEFADTGSVILQDRESETESSKNPTGRRSKRAWKLSVFDHQQQFHHHNKQSQELQQTIKKIKLSKLNNRNESLSSVSDTTTEEDVAFCLMMLSRDKWKRKHELKEEQYEEEEEENEEEEDEEEEEEEEEEDEESDESEEELKSSKTATRVRGRYKCETCNKVFRSYQALGGHRASHKKIKVTVYEPPELKHGNNNNGGASSVVPVMVDKKIHECPVCFRVFASGQALGGHKRTHVTGSAAAAAATTNLVRSSIKFRESLIDLNLPAPIDDDDVSQFEDSAVSDAEFVKSH